MYHLDPALFRKALEAVTNRQMINCLSLEEKMATCLDIANTTSLPDEKKSNLALVIHFRLEALANYLAAGGAHGFRHKGLLGSDMLDPGVVTCAAIEPIIEEGDQITFEPLGFEQRLLGIVKTAGSV